MKTISVIIPSYNREKYIAVALDSVLSQALPKGFKLEVIVVDDGSTDNTKEVIKPYLKSITYIQIDHSGKPATARNAGIKAARGELVAFQDSDDLWTADKLLNQLPVFESKNVVFSFGQAKVMNQDGEISDVSVVNELTLKSATSYDSMLIENPVCTLTVMVRKDALDKVGLFNESSELRAIEDYDLWLRIAAAFPGGVKPLTEVLAYYRRHDQNISAGDNLKGIENALTIYRSSWKDPNLSDSNRENLESQLIEMEHNWSNHKNELDGDKKPTVSVVMSVYNGERFLRPAIDSILGQTFENFEFIIVNDGSSDTSHEIIESYQDPRIRLIPQTNHGLVFSLNRAIELARGDFIARMDADDISLSKRFENEVEWLNADPRRGLVSTYFSHINFADGKPTGTIIAIPINHIDLRRALYFVNPFAHGAAMYRKQAIIDEGLYTDKYGPTEDYEMWRRIAKRWKVGLIPEVLFQYRINNPDSVSQSKNEIQAKFIAKIHDELWSEKFVRKNLIKIIYDYYRIKKQVQDTYVSPVKNEYINHQFTLAKFSLLRGYFFRFAEIAAALIFIKASYVPRLFPFIPKGILTSIKRLK